MDELRVKLLHELIGIYGLGHAQSIGAVIIPAFINDFRETALKKDTFDEISEEYMTEDKKVHLVMYGRKRLAGNGPEVQFTAFSINDRFVELQK
ncbi:MAG: hypothetical protein J6N21_04175 [Butyrivibrio sp.]|nr:hypothetical protein [Butyrivibrio sp.]MBP3196185.1 hypothetical protein [Butyrivibrio sp.]MBQ9589332.1 hypothetical protein [Butyrivibrio sp.]